MKKLLSILLCLPITVYAAEVDDSIWSHLTLIDAEKMWQQKNREVQLATDLIRSAEADKRIAAVKPNPLLSLNNNSLSSASRDGLRQSDMVLRLDQPIERGGKRELRMRAAQLRFEATQQDLAESKRQGRLSLHQAYFDLWLAQEKLRVAQENVRLFEQTLAANQKRLNAGDIAPAELSRIKVDALRATNEMHQIESDTQQNKLALAYQIGAEANANQLHVDDTPVESASDAQPNLDKRPDVTAANLRLQAAEAAHELAIAQTTRDVTIGVQMERNGNNSPMNSLGVGVSVPLFTGNEFKGDIERAENDVTLAKRNVTLVKAKAQVELERARYTLKTARQRMKHFDEQLLNETKRSLDSAEFAYSHGALSVMDLLDARRTYKAVQVDAVNARAEYAKAQAAWRFVQAE